MEDAAPAHGGDLSPSGPEDSAALEYADNNAWSQYNEQMEALDRVQGELQQVRSWLRMLTVQSAKSCSEACFSHAVVKLLDPSVINRPQQCTEG